MQYFEWQNYLNVCNYSKNSSKIYLSNKRTAEHKQVMNEPSVKKHSELVWAKELNKHAITTERCTRQAEAWSSNNDELIKLMLTKNHLFQVQIYAVWWSGADNTATVIKKPWVFSLNKGKNPLHQFPRSKSVTSQLPCSKFFHGRWHQFPCSKSVTSPYKLSWAKCVVSCHFPNSTTTTCYVLVSDIKIVCHVANKSVISWQEVCNLPIYGEMCIMDFGHNWTTLQFH